MVVGRCVCEGCERGDGISINLQSIVMEHMFWKEALIVHV